MDIFSLSLLDTEMPLTAIKCYITAEGNMEQLQQKVHSPVKDVLFVTSDPPCRTAWCAGRATCAQLWLETLALQRKFQITGQYTTRSHLLAMWSNKFTSINHIASLPLFTYALCLFHISLCTQIYVCLFLFFFVWACRFAMVT